MKPEVHVPLFEMLKSVPETFGIRFNEEPEYDIIRQDGNFEVRRYHKQLHASFTSAETDFEKFRDDAFANLAAYLFGGNKQKEVMAMTTPVFHQKTTMTFVLPEKYHMQNAPTPFDEAIQVREIPGYDVAVLSYSGNPSLESIRLHEKKLSEWLEKSSEVQKVGEFMSAQYDQPFVIPFLKRNEVMVKIKLIQ